MRVRVTLLCLISLSLLLLAPIGASAYCRLRTDALYGEQCESSAAPLLYWGRTCVSYIFHEGVFSALPLLSEIQTRNIAQSAFASWVNHDCTDAPFLVEQSRGTTSGPAIAFAGDRRNEFVISVMTPAEWEQWELDPLALAVTKVWYSRPSGEIVDVDMVLNRSHGEFADCAGGCDPGTVDLQNTLTHEAGHALGLGHSQVSGATMEDVAVFGATHMRSLTADDIAGVCAVQLPSHGCYDGSEACRCPPPPIFHHAASCSVQGPGLRSGGTVTARSSASRAPPLWQLAAVVVFSFFTNKRRVRRRARRRG